MTEIRVVQALAPLRRSHPWLIPSMVGLGLLAALSEGVGLSLFMPFFYSLGAGTFATPDDSWLGSTLRRLVESLPASERLVAISVGMIGLVFLKNLLVYATQVLQSWSHMTLVHSLRARLAHCLLHVRLDVVENTDSGKLLNTLQNQTQETGAAFATYGELLVHVCALVIFAVLLFLVSWKLTLGVGGALLAISLLIRLVWRRVESGSHSFAAAWDELSQRGLELIWGMRTIRVFDRQDYEHDRFVKASLRVSTSWLHLDLLSGLVRPVSEVLVVTVLVAVLLGSLRDVANLPTVLTFAFILYRLRPHVQGIDVARAQLLAAKAPVETVMRMLDSDQAPPQHSGSLHFEGLREEIRFENVGFRHRGVEHESLQQVTLRIPAHRVTALIGPSGAGKSTLIHVLLRLYDPTCGSILVDGIPLADLRLNAWRRRVAAVTQDAILFNASVRENIAYGRTDLTPDNVIRAAKRAGADEFIRNLPMTYDTIVGDQGVRLSGGQKQRLALARALVLEPDILILDEATNALDAETERLVQDALAAMGKTMTLIVVSHHLSAVAHADHFVILEDGRVTAQGGHAEIAAMTDAVRRLYGQRLMDARQPSEIQSISAASSV